MKRAIVIGAARLLLVPSLVVGLRAQIISPAHTSSPQAAGAQKLRLAEVYGRLPLSFEANEGQTNRKAKFLARAAGHTLFLTSTGAVLGSEKGEPVGMRLLGANRDAQVSGLDKLPGISNYFVGNDQAKWHSNIPTYARVRYRAVYPGVDLLFYGNQREVEYDFVVAPGANPAQIRLAIEGARWLSVDSEGNAVLHGRAGDIRLLKPRVYQEIGGKRAEVAGRYLIKGRTVRFEIGDYDRRQALIIDPVLSYSTFLGGSGADTGTAIAADASGNVYVTGTTTSTDFPGINSSSFQSTESGGSAFVTKLNPTASAVLFSTYLGFSGDQGLGIAVDSSANVYVTGIAFSAGFPLTSNAILSSFFSPNSGFLTKLNATGSALIYSTFLRTDRGKAIAVDAAGNAYVTGWIQDLGLFSCCATSYFGSSGTNDVYVAKIDPTGNTLLYSAYVGGTSSQRGWGIAADSSGVAYVTGDTSSKDFPVTPGALQTTFGGASDAFALKLDPTGKTMVYSTYIGGTGAEQSHAIAIDSSGNAYMAGNKAGIAIAMKINSDATSLLYSTPLTNFLCCDSAEGIAVDSSGQAYVTGETGSKLITVDPIQANWAGGGGYDAFVSQLDASGNIVFATYLGGDSDDRGAGIATDASGGVYVTGVTGSITGSTIPFPTTSGVVQQTVGGQAKVFVTKFQFSTSTATTTQLGSSVNPAVFGQGLTLTATVASSASGTPTGTVTFSDGATSIGSATLSNGQASLSASSFTAGTHSVTATYSGDATFAGSTSAALSQTIQQGGTSVSISVSQNPSVGGQPVTFTATVGVVAPAAGAPTGIVSFLDGTTSLGGAQVSGGQATLTTSSLSVGSHAITATYSGDPNFVGSSSSSFSLAVTQTTTIALAVSPNPAAAGQPVSLAATVTSNGAGTPTGNVTFLDGTTTLGSGALMGGTATFITSSLAPGSHSLTASYPGDASFAPSSSSAVTLSVQLTPAVITVNETITVTDTPSFPDVVDAEQISVADQVAIQVLDATTTSISTAAVTFGTPASPTVVVNSSTATVNGNVTLSVDGGAATALPLTSGAATFSLGVLPAGSHLLAANFAAQGNFTASSAQATLVINPVTPTITWANPSPITFGTPLTSTQLNATASVPGTFVYTPAAGTVLSVGSNQTLSVTFHPTDSMDYTPSTANVTITVLNTGVGTNVTVTPVDTTTGTTPVTVNFGNVTTAGMTGLTIGLIGAPPPPGYRIGNPGAYFDISTTAAFAGTATVCINYTGIAAFLNPAGPHFFHYENGVWVDHTVSIDTINKNVCGTVASFSPFALFDPLPVLTITGNSAFRQYGLADPAFTASYSGFVNGDTPASLSGALSCVSNDTASTPVGTYAINCSGLSSSNYNIAYVPGTLTITPAPLTITANNASRPYGANNPEVIPTIMGALNADSITAYDTINATPTSLVGSYAVVPTAVGAQNVLGNYSISLVNGALTVAPETTALSMTVAPTSIALGQSAIITVTLTASDMVIPIDPSVLAAITVSSPVVSDILTNNGVCTPAPSATPGVASCTITVTSIEPNGRTLKANFPGTANLTPSSATADLIVAAALQSQQTCIASDFRYVAVPGGSYLWFNSIFKVGDVPKQKITITFFQSSVQFQYKDVNNNVVTINQPMPDAKIVIDPTLTSASTTFDPVNNAWLTTVPFDTDDAAFLTGLPWLVPANGIPGDVEPVTWCGTFASDTPNVEIGWRWAAAAYSSFSSDGSVLGIKPMDTDHDNSAQNHDRAGTPENYKQFVVPGARGKGGKNYTGSYTGNTEIE